MLPVIDAPAKFKFGVPTNIFFFVPDWLVSVLCTQNIFKKCSVPVKCFTYYPSQEPCRHAPTDGGCLVSFCRYVNRHRRRRFRPIQLPPRVLRFHIWALRQFRVTEKRAHTHSVPERIMYVPMGGSGGGGWGGEATNSYWAPSFFAVYLTVWTTRTYHPVEGGAALLLPW